MPQNGIGLVFPSPPVSSARAGREGGGGVPKARCRPVRPPKKKVRSVSTQGRPTPGRRQNKTPATRGAFLAPGDRPKDSPVFPGTAAPPIRPHTGHGAKPETVHPDGHPSFRALDPQPGSGQRPTHFTHLYPPAGGGGGGVGPLWRKEAGCPVCGVWRSPPCPKRSGPRRVRAMAWMIPPAWLDGPG